MKRILMLFVLSFCSFGQSALDLACQNLIERDQDTVKTNRPVLQTDDSRLFMMTKRGHFQIFDLNNKEKISEFRIDQKINDFQIIEGNIWALTNDSLLQISIHSKEIVDQFPTTFLNFSRDKYKIAKALTKKESKLYIVNGEVSLTEFDTSLLKITNELKFSIPQKNNHRSWATGLSIHNNRIFIGFDNITYNFSTKKRAFEGIVSYDLETLERVNIVKVRQSIEAYHEPKLFTYKGSIIANNLFLYFFNDAKKLLKQKKITPQRRLYKFDQGEPVGTLTPYKDHFIGCFSNRSRSSMKFSFQKI